MEAHPFHKRQLGSEQQLYYLDLDIRGTLELKEVNI